MRRLGRVFGLAGVLCLAACVTASTPFPREREEFRCVAATDSLPQLVCDSTDGGLQQWRNCRCPGGGRLTVYPACGEGQWPANDAPGFAAARFRASRDGTLVGDRFNGHAICLPAPPH